MSYDFVIVGAGIVGMTIARELKARDPAARVAIVDKEPHIGVHASGRNSGVLHTGIYYPAGTLKAQLCRAGAEAMYAYASERGIACRRDGKVVVATSEENAKGLDGLLANARAGGIHAERVGPEAIRELEPHATREFGGIWCRDTAVIDSPKVLTTLHAELRAAGVEFRFGQRVTAVDDARRELVTHDTRLRYGTFVNAAGAYADVIAQMAGVANHLRLIPFKGVYWKLAPEEAHRVRGSIYPVPNPNLPFLGIHFTRVISGDVYVGPTAIPALGRENYGVVAGARPLEAAGIGIELAKLYARNPNNFRALVHAEVPNYLPSRFLRSARRLVDRLDAGWLEPSPKVGIRPQLLDTRVGKLEMDFVVERGAHSVHVLNAISPAFTSSFAFAKFVVEKINGHQQ